MKLSVWISVFLVFPNLQTNHINYFCSNYLLLLLLRRFQIPMAICCQPLRISFPFLLNNRTFIAAARENGTGHLVVVLVTHVMIKAGSCRRSRSSAASGTNRQCFQYHPTGTACPRPSKTIFAKGSYQNMAFRTRSCCSSFRS